jgi:hypothetical protein
MNALVLALIVRLTRNDSPIAHSPRIRAHKRSRADPQPLVEQGVRRVRHRTVANS